MHYFSRFTLCMGSAMRRYAIKTSAATVVFLMLSNLALAAENPSLATRLLNWLRSNIPIFNLKEQRAEHKTQDAERKTQKLRHETRDVRHESLKSQDSSLKSGVLSLESYNRSMQKVGNGVLKGAKPLHAKLLRFYNYPNPFIPDLGTDFICELDGEATLELKVFGMNGSLVKKLSWESSNSPPHWDGEDTIGRTVRTGMYIYFLKVTDAITGEVADTRCGKMMAWYMD